MSGTPGQSVSSVLEWLPALDTAPGFPGWPSQQLLRVRDCPGAGALYEWLLDELWVYGRLVEARKQTNRDMRDGYDARSRRVLGALRDARPTVPGLWP